MEEGFSKGDTFVEERVVEGKGWDGKTLAHFERK